MLKILTLNIGNPSLERAKKQVKWIEQRNEDIFILTETKMSSGCLYMAEYFEQYGLDIFSYQSEKRYSVFFPKSQTGDLGVMIISRWPIKKEYSIFEKNSIYYSRVAFCEVLYHEKKYSILGTYIPSRDRSEFKILRKKNFCVYLLEYINHIRNKENLILGGDLNIVSRKHIPHYSTFYNWEYEFYDSLCEKFVDSYDKIHPNEKGFTWIGRTVNGYRYDYIFVSYELEKQIYNCNINSETRELSLSDHAAVILELDV